MKNINYYLNHYGNFDFKTLPFNEIDALIFCQIGYLNLDQFSSSPDEDCYLMDIVSSSTAKELTNKTVSSKKNLKMVNQISRITRYKDIYFKDYSNKTCTEKYKQFFAVSFFIDDFIFITYRGTDFSINGWHEDFTMSYLDEIPSQRDAVDYLNEIYDKYGKKMIVGGHSKGGNLALYSSLYAKDAAIDNITKIYNFDGPGFNKHEIYEGYEFNRIKDRLISIASRMSLVGILMYHVEDMEFLKTSGVSFLAHEAFTWHINDSLSFKRVKKNRARSRFWSEVSKNIIRETTAEDRKRLVDIFFYIAKDNPKSSLLDIKSHPIKYMMGMKHRKKLLNKEDLYFYKNELKKYRRIITSTMKYKIKNRIKK